MIISDDIKEENVLFCQNHPYKLGKKICHLRDEKLKIQRGRENWLVETSTGSNGM